MLPNLLTFTPLIALLIFGIGFTAYAIRLKHIYNKYLSIDGYTSGKEAAAMMMQNAGYTANFAIVRAQKYSLNPFSGNLYLPDENTFIMKREIMDGKTLLSFCVGCQLATSAILYHQGHVKNANAVEFMGKYGLKYVFRKKEIDEILNSNYIIQR